MSIYRHIFSQLPEAVIVTDSVHRVLSLNLKAQEILDISENEVKGLRLQEVVNIPQLINLLDETILYLRQPNLTHDSSIISFDGNGRNKYYKVALNPVFSTSEQIDFIITTLTDVTILKEIEQLKVEYFATASHEFRTPLTSILMGVGMLKNDQVCQLSERGREIIEAIEEDCSRLLRLTENLLDLSRMEVGAITMDWEDANVYKLVNAALGTLKLQARKRNIKLYTSLPSDLPPIKADINKIIWVLTNLVANALRYTSEGGSVTVKVIRKGAKLYFSVSDTGKGIPPEYHETIFQKYVQIKEEDEDYSQRGGAGLGLAICRDIVEAHGGDIWVKSEPGEGSTFTFSIPVARG